jgi:hypothetical protein
MKTTLYHLDVAIEALRAAHPAHAMLWQLEQARNTIMMLAFKATTPHMFAEYRQ